MMALNPQFERQKNFQLLALIAMASFGMLFGTFILSYLLARARMPVWPPIGVDPLDLTLPTLSTGLLLVSSAFVVSAERALRSGKWGVFRQRWLVAVGMGLGFLGLQYLVLSKMWGMGMFLNSDLYTGSVQFLILMHAFHLTIALGGLGCVGWRAIKNEISQKSGLTVQIVAWFWHFVDVVWLAMFLAFLM